jgi:oligopeptidase A
MNNPLLNFDQLPFFKSIEAAHVLPALESILDDCRTSITRLETIEEPNWPNFAQILEDLDERIGRVWSPVGHLNAVKDSAELREAYQAGIAQLTAYQSELGQNQKLYSQYLKLQLSEDYAALSPAQKKVISNAVQDFKLGGAELSGPDQLRLSEINKQLSELSNQFERNLLDATQSWEKLILDPKELTGLPSSAIEMASQLALEAGKEGYLFTLQIPSYIAVMQHADDRNFRREMYLAYTTRASELSESPEFDNSGLIVDILKLRREKAKLLGYNNYADYSLVKKMAKSSDTVIEFLGDLVQYAKPVADKEIAELKAFANSLDQSATSEQNLEAWDISYYSEKLRESRYTFTDEQIKPYFPAPLVFDGLFEIVNRLFGISLQENISIETWYDEVRCFDVFDHKGELIGQLYTDLYVRKNKRGGAWMGSCIDRRVIAGDVQLPVAFLTCNFSPPIGNNPALLTHDEVETLFHEFGHTLHHLLTQIDEMSVAGISGVAWDAVELPSQFLENWCWHEQSLRIIARHYKTGEELPEQLIAKMRAAKNFQSGMQCLRQVEFALFDMHLHASFDPSQDDVQELLNQIRSQVAVLMPPESNRFQNSFGHIFAGGYAAGYYSYKWAEVLSADAFGRFEDEGIFNAQTGNDFLRSVLQRGGVDDANDLFKEFRGRAPKIEPLLQQTGIL